MRKQSDTKEIATNKCNGDENCFAIHQQDCKGDHYHICLNEDSWKRHPEEQMSGTSCIHKKKHKSKYDLNHYYISLLILCYNMVPFSLSSMILYK